MFSPFRLEVARALARGSSIPTKHVLGIREVVPWFLMAQIIKTARKVPWTASSRTESRCVNARCHLPVTTELLASVKHQGELRWKPQHDIYLEDQVSCPIGH